MTKLILVRHADSEWTEEAKRHPEPKFGGRMNDCKLCSAGHDQSRRLSRAMLKAGIRPDAIYSSAAVRAMDTAAPFAKACRLTVIPVENLQELSWGDWEGKPRSIQDSFAEERAKLGFDFRPPGADAESPNMVRLRIMKELQAIQVRGYDCVVVFMHRNGIKNVIRDAMGWKTPEQQDKAVIDVCSLTTVRFKTIRTLEVIEFNKQLI